MASRMTGADWIMPSRTMANRWPLYCSVICPHFFAPSPSTFIARKSMGFGHPITAKVGFLFHQQTFSRRFLVIIFGSVSVDLDFVFRRHDFGPLVDRLQSFAVI